MAWRGYTDWESERDEQLESLGRDYQKLREEEEIEAKQKQAVEEAKKVTEVKVIKEEPKNEPVQLRLDLGDEIEA